MTQLMTGSMVAIATPMHDDGSLDYAALRSLLDWHVIEGTDAIVIVGTSGESPTVSVEEHCELIRVAVEQIKGRIPVIAGTGGNSTREAIELTEFAKKWVRPQAYKWCRITTSQPKRVCTLTLKRLPRKWISP